jgi:hypothetical protein
VACGHPSCPAQAGQALECPRNRVNSTPAEIEPLHAMPNETITYTMTSKETN